MQFYCFLTKYFIITCTVQVLTVTHSKLCMYITVILLIIIILTKFNDLSFENNCWFSFSLLVPPYFPAISLSRANKTENDTHTFSCTAEGKPQARILWMLNGKNLSHTPPYNISESFSKVQDSKLYNTLGYLTITSITWRDKGLYSCVAYNPAGRMTQSAELNVKCKEQLMLHAKYIQYKP